MPPFTELRAGVPGGASLHHLSLDPAGDRYGGRPGSRPVVLCELDASFRRGALSPADGATLEHAARTALAQRLPLVVLVASSGADVHEGLDALVGWGRAARALVECSGIVPLLFGVVGPAVSGPALLLGLADQVVMTEDAYAFVSGPRMVRAFTGVPIGNEALATRSTCPS